MQVISTHVIAKRAKITHVQTGIPSTRMGFFSGLGLGISVWQRQQTRLSSGFHVPQFGQSGMAG
jgi:hypothetical protein